MSDMGDWIGVDVPQVILDDASAWMALLDAERCSLADRMAFARWLEADVRHRLAYEELSSVWARLHTLGDLRPALDDQKVTRLHEHTRAAPATLSPSYGGGLQRWSGIAVLAVLLLGLAVRFSVAEPAQHYTTRVAELNSQQLDAHTQVQQNSRSKISFWSDQRRRSLRLHSGEVLIDVRADGREFSAQASTAVVRTKEAQFALRDTDGVLTVSVLSGEVSVQQNPAQSVLSASEGESPSLRTPRIIRLSAGEQMLLAGAQHQLSWPGIAQIERKLSWRNGVVVFEDEPLEMVVHEINRYATGSVSIADDSLRSLLVSGVLQTNDPHAFLVALHDQYAIEVNDQHDYWTQLKAPPTTF